MADDSGKKEGFKAFLANPLGIIPKIFQRIFKLGFVIAFWVIFIFLIIFLARSTAFGGIISSGVSPILAPLAKIWHTGTDLFFNPEKILKPYEWKPEVTEQQVKKGVELKNLKPVYDSYREGDEMQVTAVALVDALAAKETKVSFYCNVIVGKAYINGTMSVNGEQTNLVAVPAADENPVKSEYDLECDLPAIPSEVLDHAIFGLGPAPKDTGDSLGNTVEKTINTKLQAGTFAVKLTWVYEDFETTHSLEIYNKKKPEVTLTELEVLRKGDLKDIKNARMGSDGHVRSRCRSGCGLTLLTLNTVAQPLYVDLSKDISYPFEISMRNDLDYTGGIKQLKEIRVAPSEKSTDTLQFVQDGGFGGDYILNQQDSLLVQDNKRLQENSNADLSYRLKFKMMQEREVMDFDEILVKAVYDYGGEATTSVKVIANPLPAT